LKKNAIRKILDSYMFDHLLWFAATLLWYKAFLFRCVDELSLSASVCIFLGIATVCFGIGILMDRHKGRKVVHILLDIGITYGLYTVVSHYHTGMKLIPYTIRIVGFISAFYLILFAICNVRGFKWNVNYLKRYLLQLLTGIRYVLGIGMLGVLVALSFYQVFGLSMIVSHKDRVSLYEIEDKYRDSRTEYLSLLQKDRWKELSLDERLNVLQIVADIEKENLGVSHDIRVGANNIDQDIRGCYSDSSYEIVLNIDYLSESNSLEMVRTICHETRHAYQHQLIDLYEQLDDKYKSLMIFDDVSSYRYEFRNYSDLKEDYDDYFTMNCEIDSRSYAEEASKKYLDYINE